VERGFEEVALPGLGAPEPVGLEAMMCDGKLGCRGVAPPGIDVMEGLLGRIFFSGVFRKAWLLIELIGAPCS